MRLTVLLTLSLTLSVAAGTYSQNTKLNLSLTNASIEQVLLEIENNSKFIFIYENGTIDKSIRRTISVKEQSVEDILAELLNGTDIRWQIDDRQISLFREGSPSLLDSSSGQQQTPVSGRVTDASGFPLPGVTIMLKGTSQGTVTDADGNYVIKNVPGDGTLVFSFVGMLPQELFVAGKSSIDVVMEEQTIGIEEVVAVGYGVQKKSDITGSVTSVSKDRLSGKLPVANAMQAIQGAAAGITITQASSIPGDEPSTLVRGQNSINADTSPYIVVDGIPISKSGGTINDINPNDIASIEILKDASAVAIYGTNGANGVVLITTKRGSTGKPSIR
ncbi:MAG: carboxypeptidase-like regulatory domain-containing protein, partial [Mangrovibacterium sp.]